MYKVRDHGCGVADYTGYQLKHSQKNISQYSNKSHLIGDLFYILFHDSRLPTYAYNNIILAYYNYTLKMNGKTFAQKTILLADYFA